MKKQLAIAAAIAASVPFVLYFLPWVGDTHYAKVLRQCNSGDTYQCRLVSKNDQDKITNPDWRAQ